MVMLVGVFLVGILVVFFIVFLEMKLIVLMLGEVMKIMLCLDLDLVFMMVCLFIFLILFLGKVEVGSFFNMFIVILLIMSCMLVGSVKLLGMIKFMGKWLVSMILCMVLGILLNDVNVLMLSLCMMCK